MSGIQRKVPGASDVTIVMYHYVRPLAHTPWPAIKGLDLALFREQVAYLRRHYNPIGAAELMDAVVDGADLPPRALLLTFDDGYRDHNEYVLPTLLENGLPGCFFPPGACVAEREILIANKIHFILAAQPDRAHLVAHIDGRLAEYRREYRLQDAQHYWDKHAQANRFDTAEVIYIKRMLQHELPEPLRNRIVDELFRDHVSRDPLDFADQLYLNTDELRDMVGAGMYVGSHGYRHYWMNTLPPRQQQQEVTRSMDFLHGIGSDTARWMMCYPYGGYDDALLQLLRDNSCVAGLTTAVDIADLQRDDPLLLPRLDTNDLPKQADAAPCEWTRQVIGKREAGSGRG